MQTKPGREAVAAHAYALAASAEEASGLWVYINFLDDLANGFLAYKAIGENEVDSLEEILDHDAVVVIRHKEGHGGTLAPYIHGASADQQAAQANIFQFLMLRLPGPDEFPVEELSALDHTDREVIAAITLSRATSERAIIMLFYLPQFEEDVIFAALKGAIAM